MTAADLLSLVPLLSAGIPLLFVVAALFVSRSAPFQSAVVASGTATLFAVSASAASALQCVLAVSPTPIPMVRLDVVTCVMLTLVCALSVSVVRYSRVYLGGESGQDRFARALLVTLAAVTLLVVSNNLGVIVLAWTGTSLALHRLLKFYPERAPAIVVAHKKLLLSRAAEFCLFVALALIASTVGSVDLDSIDAWVRVHQDLPLSLHAASVVLVLGVALKAAQLPFHGWLIQVMEAPTPVSALLHAGVVNIGGLVMIRLAPLMSHAPFAQTLLIVIGMTTAIIASLVMTTRVSVKVSLAWSTCAQMGFMLVQCGLGAWHLALLHLVAHSLYKAHAFLSSGGAVESWRTNALVKPRPQPSPLRVALFATLALVGVGAWFWVTQTLAAEFDPTLAAWIAILGLSLVPTLAGPTTGVEVVWVAGKSIGIVALYFVWHAAFARALPTLSVPHESALAWVMVVLGFGLLLAIQTLLQARPASPLSTTLRPLLFAGLHLDEIITRALFRLWPPPMKRRGMTPVMRVMKGSEVLP